MASYNHVRSKTIPSAPFLSLGGPDRAMYRHGLTTGGVSSKQDPWSLTATKRIININHRPSSRVNQLPADAQKPPTYRVDVPYHRMKKYKNRDRMKGKRVKKPATKKIKNRRFDSTKGYPGEGPTMYVCTVSKCQTADHYHKKASSGYARRKQEEKSSDPRKKPRYVECKLEECKLPEHFHTAEQIINVITSNDKVVPTHVEKESTLADDMGLGEFKRRETGQTGATPITKVTEACHHHKHEEKKQKENKNHEREESNTDSDHESQTPCLPQKEKEVKGTSLDIVPNWDKPFDGTVENVRIYTRTSINRRTWKVRFSEAIRVYNPLLREFETVKAGQHDVELRSLKNKGFRYFFKTKPLRQDSKVPEQLGIFGPQALYNSYYKADIYVDLKEYLFQSKLANSTSATAKDGTALDGFTMRVRSAGFKHPHFAEFERGKYDSTIRYVSNQFVLRHLVDKMTVPEGAPSFRPQVLSRNAH